MFNLGVEQDPVEGAIGNPASAIVELIAEANRAVRASN
jgi:hypothetical protein